jgi:hypothetical protein
VSKKARQPDKQIKKKKKKKTKQDDGRDPSTEKPEQAVPGKKEKQGT